MSKIHFLQRKHKLPPAAFFCRHIAPQTAILRRHPLQPPIVAKIGQQFLRQLQRILPLTPSARRYEFTGGQ